MSYDIYRFAYSPEREQVECVRAGSGELVAAVSLQACACRGIWDRVRERRGDEITEGLRRVAVLPLLEQWKRREDARLLRRLLDRLAREAVT